jgi:hypothetical protein
MPIGVYYRRPVSHVPSSFGCPLSFELTAPNRITVPGGVNDFWPVQDKRSFGAADGCESAGFANADASSRNEI